MAVPITLQLLRCRLLSGPKHTTRFPNTSRGETQRADAGMRAPAWQRTGPAKGRGLLCHVLFLCQGLPGRARARPVGNSAPIIPDGGNRSRAGRGDPTPHASLGEIHHKLDGRPASLSRGESGPPAATARFTRRSRRGVSASPALRLRCGPIPRAPGRRAVSPQGGGPWRGDEP
jgi:hypothetical protein